MQCYVPKNIEEVTNIIEQVKSSSSVKEKINSLRELHSFFDYKETLSYVDSFLISAIQSESNEELKLAYIKKLYVLDGDEGSEAYKRNRQDKMNDFLTTEIKSEKNNKIKLAYVEKLNAQASGDKSKFFTPAVINIIEAAEQIKPEDNNAELATEIYANAANLINQADFENGYRSWSKGKSNKKLMENALVTWEPIIQKVLGTLNPDHHAQTGQNAILHALIKQEKSGGMCVPSSLYKAKEIKNTLYEKISLFRLEKLEMITPDTSPEEIYKQSQNLQIQEGLIKFILT